MKRFTHWGLGSILAGLLLGGCASTGQLDVSKAPLGNVMRFAALDGAAPPVGAMQFCAADPERCGPQAAAYFQGEPAASSDIAVGGIEDSNAQSDGRSDAFRYMLAARRKSEVRAKQAKAEGVIFVSADKAVHVTLTDELWSQLKDVQKKINQALRPATDQEIYGKEEVWALPLESWTLKGAPRGDCEDFALQKRLRLLNLGWAPEALSIVVVDAPRIGAHAVLVVSTDRGEFVLDNLQYEPVLAETLPYKWLSRQSGLDLLAWTQTRLTQDIVPVAAPAASPMRETLFADLMQKRIERIRAQQESDALMAAAIAVLPSASTDKPADFAIELPAWTVDVKFDGDLDAVIASWAGERSIDIERGEGAASAPELETMHQHPLAQALVKKQLLSV